VIAVLVDRMGLPRRSPDNQLMSYRLHHRASGRQLLDSETLTAAEVQNGDILRLQPEITAGCGSFPLPRRERARVRVEGCRLGDGSAVDEFDPGTANTARSLQASTLTPALSLQGRGR
jgi:hypothetical protein